MKQSVVIIDPNVLGGTPVFKGTRVPIQNLFDWLENETLDNFLNNFPSVKKEQALEVLRIAEKLVTDRKFVNENIAGRKSTHKT
jgi:uncharacterized protein (DUF433 family)